MNRILFHSEEITGELSRSDSRAEHLLSVLKIHAGDTFDVGQINGPAGKATLEKITSTALELSYTWHDAPPPPLPIDLWVSFCRPQTCRRILQECTSLGIRSITFFDTDKCEPTYKDSRLWSSGEAERLMIRGAEQAFCTRIPKLAFADKLEALLESDASGSLRIAMDNYEATADLSQFPVQLGSVTLAIGGERGWSAQERNMLRESNFSIYHLGPRGLRTETACIAAITLLRTKIPV